MCRGVLSGGATGGSRYYGRGKPDANVRYGVHVFTRPDADDVPQLSPASPHADTVRDGNSRLDSRHSPLRCRVRISYTTRAYSLVPLQAVV